MKTKLHYSVVHVFVVALLFAFFSCQTEELQTEELNEQLISDPSDTSKSKKRGKPDLVFDAECDPSVFSNPINLYAGQHILVGELTVKFNNGNYDITYNITNNEYCLTETHISVVQDPLDFPMANGNPIPGQFEFKSTHDCVSSYTYSVPIDKGTYFAVHGVVNCVPDHIGNVESNIPETTGFCLRTGREIENARSYFKASIADGALSGDYWAWCVDVSKSIDSSGEDKCYTDFNVYSINDDLSGLISQSGNLDNALWLLNNIDTLLDGGNYLYGHIQWAFWKLLNDQECNSCNANLKLPAGENIKIKGLEIYNLAIANGDGYSPECGEDTMLIIDNGVLQPILIPYTIPCDGGDCEETLWADGCDFPGNNWATYFRFLLGA
ncbi:hypothetical protein VOI54_17645 [Tamlana sp. 2201CG12-4]|uniref:hypothetical protein n=1 Tax=Tamlana sp. 2201CG12-4 TaxID=3112582 RepID=UPI002DBB93EE|nr:hypothetical protein [Tamlana sp. 2201CG12-4]MEC3908856.1 hypothetical protein [Tamlana sp. 2201CG12-4]